MNSPVLRSLAQRRLQAAWRHLLAVGGSLTLLLGLTTALALPITSKATTSPFAMLAGTTTSTNITSLSCYGTCPGGGSHSHSYPNPVDMGAGTSTPSVFAQADYLPSDIAGGYALAYRDTTGQCGEKNDPYNGRRITVQIYHYNTSGSYVNWNYESYLHVEPYSGVSYYISSAPWLHWNNPYSSSPMWPSYIYDFNLNNLTSGGLYLGYVHNVTQTDSACTDGNHLHQESDNDGAYRPGLSVGQATTARYTDLHYVTLTGIAGSAP